MDLCSLSSPPSLPAWSRFIRAASSWALSIQGQKLYTHSGQPVPVFDLLCNNKKRGFFCLSGNSVFLFVASYPVTGHYWEKCISAVPCPGIYPHSSQSVRWPPAFPGPFHKAALHHSVPSLYWCIGVFLPSAGLCISFVELYQFPVGWLLSFPAWLNTNMISTFASLPRHLQAAEIPVWDLNMKLPFILLILKKLFKTPVNCTDHCAKPCQFNMNNIYVWYFLSSFSLPFGISIHLIIV